MTPNVGGLDKVLRISAGIVLIARGPGPAVLLDPGREPQRRKAPLNIRKRAADRASLQLDHSLRTFKEKKV